MAALPVLRNLITNPSVEVDLTGWSVGAPYSPLSRLNTDTPTVNYYARATATTTTGATAGQVVLNYNNGGPGTTIDPSKYLHVSIRLRRRNTGGPSRVRLLLPSYGDSGFLGSVYAQQNIALAAGTAWTEVRAIVTPEQFYEGTKRVVLGIYPEDPFTVSVGGQLDADAAMLVQLDAPYTVNYFDGTASDTATYDYGWEGAAHASVSYAVPTQMAATPHVPSGTIDLVASAPSPRAFVDVYRQVGNGQWEMLFARVAMSNYKWVGVDYDPPLGVEVRYRADFTDTSNGPVALSVQSDLVAATTLPGRIFLRNVGDPDFILSPQVEGFDGVTRESRAAVYEVVNRSAPVVVASARASRTGSVRLLTKTLAERDEMWRLLEATDIAVIRSDYEYGVGTLYCAINSVTEERVSRLGATAFRRWTLDYVETDPPIPSDLTAANNSWQVALSGATKWDVLDDLRTTWGALLTDPIGSGEEAALSGGGGGGTTTTSGGKRGSGVPGL